MNDTRTLDAAERASDSNSNRPDGRLARLWLLLRRGLRLVSEPVWQLVYGLYEHRLQKQVCAQPMPGHVGIILDGNRRHARESGMQNPEAIYRLGAAKLDDILAWSAGLGVRMVTLWIFSPENLRRPEPEIGGIFGAVEAKMRALAADPQIHRKGVHIAAMGRRDLLPAALLEAIDAAEAATRGNDQITVTLAIGYGGREEIADAVRAFLDECAAQGLSTVQAASLVTPETIRRHLYLADMPDPDLIIRTSGEVRLSGFMLWQSVHSELYFCDVNWPALRRIDYLRAIRSYQRRERRFGV